MAGVHLQFIVFVLLARRRIPMQLFRWVATLAAVVACLLTFVPQSAALTVQFTEHFAVDHANWFDTAGVAPVNWVASGGPDGSSFVSTSFNFVNQTPGLPFPNNAVNLFRAQDEFNSSNHAFEGDWLGNGVSQFSFWVRHDAPTSLTFFARFSTASNFPAWSGVNFAPVASGAWTQITIDVAFGNPALFFEGPPPTMANFTQVFSNIGHVQIGAFGGDMAGVNHTITFDLDQPTIVPAPGVLAMLIAMGLRGRRRR
jgi:hypothetical protein